MDEFTTITATLKNITDQLEDNSLQNHETKSSKYTAVQVHLAKKGYIDDDIFQRLLSICVRDLEQDIKYTAIALKIIMTILNKVKNEAYSPDPAILVPSAVCIIRKINMTSILNNVENIRDLYINTILLYPDETLISVVSNNEAMVVELVISYNYAQLQLEYKILLYDFLYRLLTILPEEIKLSFLNSVAPILFSKVIPSILDDISCITVENDVLKLLEKLECITNELCQIDYFKIPQWMSFLENICNRKKYPQMMKNLLEKESQAWHRLWIIFIKLLKNRITSNIISSGTPINSMLPIVETAFKLDPINRSRAFQCWTVLINIFSYETSEHCINKRLKLLIIPFILNNAKVEETVVAKLNSWWHLINRFQFKFDKFVEQILISFLHFCFGRHSSSGKSTFIPGQLSIFLKRQCVEAFVEIIGHVNCPGCVDITRLEAKLINTKNLTNHWMDWTYSLKVALQISLNNITDHSIPQQALCLLQSFLLTTSSLPMNEVKEDIINDLLKILLEFVQESKKRDIRYADTVFALLLSFFIDELNDTEILSIKGENQSTLYKIIKSTLDPCFKKYYEMRTKQEMAQKLKPMTKYILQDSVGLQYIVDHILNSLPVNDISLTFWTALVENINQLDNYFDLQNVFNILIWPLESLNMFNEVKYPAKLWYTTYCKIYMVLGKADFDRNISQILNSSNIVTNSSIYFALYVTLAIFKCGLNTENTNKYETDVQLLQVLSKRIDCYEDIEELFPVLVDTLILLLQCYNSPNNINMAETIISCVKNVLKFMMSVFKGNSNVVKVSTDMENLLKAVDLAFESETYSKLFYMLTDFTTFYSKVFQNLTLSIFTKSSLKITQETTGSKDNNDKQKNSNIASEELSKKGSKLSTPNIKEGKKKRKKSEASIVNTVIENGEEFVVVQSNWKFNPKKFTENQKEKLKRKREDIPALYQDLSQSQDELSIRAWKTDSQDSTTTSKSSSISTKEEKDASSILKNLASTDVVPKILENILAEKEKNESESAHNEISKSDGENDKILTNKDCKTPRMALKDRVFRNVRNLIEKSKNESISGDTQIYNEVENTFRTPTTKKVATEITSVVKSAPPLPLSERPSRVIRKPKKFVDTQNTTLTKRHLQKKSLSKTINESLSINTINDDNKHENTDINESSSLLSEREIGTVTDNIGIQNETATVDNDKSIVKPIATTESTKSLRVKLIKNGIGKMIDKCNLTMIKTNLKCDQNEPPKEQEIESECQNTPSVSDNNSTHQPTPHQKSPTHNNHDDVPKSPVKSIIRKRKSRIEKELAIDMAVGYLNDPLIPRKRLTRKNLVRHINAPKRRRLTNKLSQTLENKVSSQQDEKVESVNNDSASVTAIEVQNKSSVIDNLLPDDVSSEDIIESSQDSTLTTVTVTKKSSKKLPVVCIENIHLETKLKQYITGTPNLLEDQCQQLIKRPTEKIVICNNIGTENEADAISIAEIPFDKSKDNNTATELNIPLNDSDCKNNKPDSSLINQQSKDDTELPQNKTDDQNKSDNNVTENMNTEEICTNDLSDDVIIIVNDLLTPIDVSSDEKFIGVGTQEIADAATQPVNQTELCSETGIYNSITTTTPAPLNNNTNESDCETKNVTDIQNDTTKTITQVENITTVDLDESNDISSPFKDDDKRKQDFINNTLEISPIKTLSPHKYNENSPSPDKTNDCIVIVLSSPVHSNGEPVEKESPEIFTEDKTSSDKIECSPTRSGINISITSPSSSLSTKKNRPQVRGGGRAAQMLGLCVPETIHSSVGSDKSNIEEVKRSNPPNTPARRNLRILYNSSNDNNEHGMDKEESGNFLKLKRVLPTTECSPSGPILKRKFVDIIDDVIISPANKRKRVSFHDPPVSTTVSVQKYIEPLGVRSPQNSAQKRQERQLRSQNCKKSPRRLDNVFNLNTALTKAVESFNDGDLPTSNDDTQMTSLEQTPTAEIVKASELNDTEPICIELLNCKDPIENIATELSSATMKSLLIKELEGKIETIGDLAKMTEVEVNRLCIKAPKVKVAKQALKEYYVKLVDKDTNLDEITTVVVVEPIDGDDNKFINMETQTDKFISVDVEMQTTPVEVTATSMQTDVPSSSTASIQTEESGYKSTADVIKTCILERHDFLEQLTEELGESEMQMIFEKLSFSTITDLYMKKINLSNANVALSRVLDHESIQRSVDKDSKPNQLSYIRDYLLGRFSSKDLNLFCINLLRELHDKFT